MRIGLIVGTRPEVIKMAPIIRTMREQGDEVEPILIATAQHREMLDQALADFDLVPDIDLDLMEADQELPALTARVVDAAAETFRHIRPDAVLVQGDTTTAFASALAAFYERIPLGHVEAGLRTYHFEAPWPEEMNRRLIAPLARWNFAPVERAKQNLLREYIPEDRIFVTGNTVIDALVWMAERVEAAPPAIPGLPVSLLSASRIILVTGHRRESFGEPLREICHALREIADRFLDVMVLYPVHLNAEVRRCTNEILRGHPRMVLLPPLSYPALVYLMKRCTFVITDSGGIQEEAPALGKPVLVTREVTERPEAIEAGAACLVGSNRKTIVETAARLLTERGFYDSMAIGTSPYGDGSAAKRIVKILKQV